MAVKIRLSRYGRIHRPYFRVIAIDGRRHREGEANEIIGSYDPNLKEQNLKIEMDRVQAWLAQGALISPGLTKLMKHYGYAVPARAAAKPEVVAKAKAETKAKAAAKPKAKKDGKTFVPATRRSLRKHAAKLKSERKVTTAAAIAEAAAAKAAAAAAPVAEAAAETPQA